MITDINAQVVQQVYYAPFGEIISEYNAYWHNGKIPDYMFNAKELDEENGMYYYSARYYASPVFTSRDPLFEKYPTLSPYAYCANNPIIYIDPDGKRIKIYFTETSAKGQTVWKAFFFNGKNQKQAPTNTFVQNFIAAYNYNAKNGGGEKMQEAANSTKYTISLMETNEFSHATTVFSGNEGHESQENAVLWNPYRGLKTTDGHVLSPATILDEEFDHAVDYENSPVQHTDRYDKYDKQYGNAEERRAKQGSTKKTAIKNKEVPANWRGEQNHDGKGVTLEKWKYQDENK
jgi:RHS repeat-associated protein